MNKEEAEKKYLEYLEGHIDNVKSALDILISLNIPFINDNKNELLDIISKHDESKYEDPEWTAYLHHWYPTSEEDSLKTEEYEAACKHHIENNPHHWDYWVKDGKLIDDIDEHEYKLYTVERLCDHMAMSIQNDNKPSEWYYVNKENIIMPDYGYSLYEEMLEKIPDDYDLPFHGTRTDGKPERDKINEDAYDDLYKNKPEDEGYLFHGYKGDLKIDDVMFFTSSRYDAEGYGNKILKVREDLFKIEEIDLNEVKTQLFTIPEEYDGIKYRFGSVYNYVIKTEDKLLDNIILEEHLLGLNKKYIKKLGKRAKLGNNGTVVSIKPNFSNMTFDDVIKSFKKEENSKLSESLKTVFLEAKMSQLKNKTKSEDPARVRKSRNVKSTYLGMSKFGILNFKTTSESRPGGHHYQTVEFQSMKPLEDVIKKNGKVMPLDIKNLFENGDINVFCTDESFSYWAWYYQAYQNDYAYIDDNIPNLDKRIQAPKVNNVRLAGALCKHLYSVLDYMMKPFVLLAISDDVNKYLNKEEDKYHKQTVATQNWYDAVKQWGSEDATDYIGMTREQIIADLSKTIKIDNAISLEDYVDDLVKDKMRQDKKNDPRLEKIISDKIIDELNLEDEYNKIKPEEVNDENTK